MKKISLFLIGLLALSGSWYFWQGFNKPAVDLASDNLKLPEVAEPLQTPAPVPANSDQSVSDLKALALKIVSRPITVMVPLSENSKNDALTKLDEFIKLIKEDYDNSYAWYDLGAYRKLIGDYVGSAEAYQFAAQIRPQDSIAYTNLGDLYGFYLKDYEKSEQNFLLSFK